jgi:AcrR family transcriptional regulator
MQMHYYLVQAHRVEPVDDSTRTRLISAAEQLFASRGVDAVSLREINRVAGAKNAVAVQYHFGDRDGVVRAVLAKHWPEIDARRNAMLDEYEAQRDGGLRALAAALVRPLASKLEDPDGGPEYLQIYAELINLPRTGEPDDADEDGRRDSVQRWRELVEPYLSRDAVRLHRRFTVIRLTAVELARRAASGPHADDRLFVSHLIDVVSGLLVTPSSEETLRLADARDSSRRGAKR